MIIKIDGKEAFGIRFLDVDEVWRWEVLKKQCSNPDNEVWVCKGQHTEYGVAISELFRIISLSYGGLHLEEIIPDVAIQVRKALYPGLD